MDEPPPDLTAEDEEAYLQEEEGAGLEEEYDGGGGFFVEDGGGGEGGGAGSSAAVQLPTCVECGEKALSRQHQEVFSVNVCKACCKTHSEKYGVCTKTTAKQDYLLADGDFKGLGFIEKKNPQKESYRAMHLYLRCQLEAAAVEKYGGITGMEVERERRRIAAAERNKGGKKTKGSVLRKEEERNPESASRSDGSEGIFQNKRAKKTEGIRAPYVGRHVHTWDSEWSEGGEGGGATIWKKKCSGCGLVQKFEKL